MNNRRKNAYLQTGQITCHDADGRDITCGGSGQDGELQLGAVWPEPRFETEEDTVIDLLTGLIWPLNANLAEFPLSWQEALDYISEMNCDLLLGYDDWRLPNRRELRSLISHQTRRPALPVNHPFINVFLNWYWSSTTAVINPSHAWYVNMDGGRMFYGGKDQSFMLWPVRGQGNGVLSATGQIACYNETGDVIDCAETGQDGEYSSGRFCCSPRFEVDQKGVADKLNNLCWRQAADLCGPVSWQKALAEVEQMNQSGDLPYWRLPNINELESLIDCATHSPALTLGHPFDSLQDIYWSSTTSLYEPDWAWALYLDKGAVGVGMKMHAKFHVWAVRDISKEPLINSGRSSLRSKIFRFEA
ncbi:hypothetical protein BMS3Bbin11_00973 [bacterium BMS3Bbin11]|nr:hypothetical protein BMS3Abin11_01480 [bacterium BMS3Abin11]GBE45880.1 hypothetical protein BMS3Bbin11_00973 [bacterium BMS3Bbin11]